MIIYFIDKIKLEMTKQHAKAAWLFISFEKRAAYKIIRKTKTNIPSALIAHFISLSHCRLTAARNISPVITITETNAKYI